MQDRSEGRPDDGADWCEFEDLPLETKCKLEGMKMMARWLVGLQSDAISAKKCFNMLNTVRNQYILTFNKTVKIFIYLFYNCTFIFKLKVS